MAEVERPSFVKDKHLLYLDELRKSGVTNMFGAGPYVEQAFRMSRDKATSTLVYWIRTFAQRHEPRKAVPAVDPDVESGQG